MNYNTNIPIYLQVINSIKKQLVVGKIKPGEKLPSTKNLALEYQVNPNTAARIYKELELEGLCFTKRGLGTYATESKELIQEIRLAMANEIIDHFICEMMELGYTYHDLLAIIKERENK